MIRSHIQKGVRLNYNISERTKAIMLAKEEPYRTKVFDGKEMIYLQEDIVKLLDRNCTANGAAMIGRNKTVEFILSSNSKLPIPVSPKKGHFFFPTTSIRNPDCILLSFYQIAPPVIPQGNGIIVPFKDDTSLFVNISNRQFLNQFQRTSQVILYYSELKV